MQLSVSTLPMLVDMQALGLQWWRKRKAAKAADESVAARTNSYNPAFDRQAGVTATGAGVWKGLMWIGHLSWASNKLLLALPSKLQESRGLFPEPEPARNRHAVARSEHPEEPH